MLPSTPTFVIITPIFVIFNRLKNAKKTLILQGFPDFPFFLKSIKYIKSLSYIFIYVSRNPYFCYHSRQKNWLFKVK